MKRITAIWMCLIILLSAAVSVPVIRAVAAGGYDDIGDLGDEVPAGADLTPEQKKAILNAQFPGRPMLTGYEPLDTLVSRILSEILEPDMTIYDKVGAIYRYLMTDTAYRRGNPTTDDLYFNLYKTISYQSVEDRDIVCEAYGMLTERFGLCHHFSSAFTVMTRALGLESYNITCGNTLAGIADHTTSVIRLGGRLYIFDPVMGVVNNKTDEVETSHYFCNLLTDVPGRKYCPIEEQIESFGGFAVGERKPAPVREEVTGKTDGDIHFTFGSYPQTRVTDPALISSLSALVNISDMRSYRYSYGKGSEGSQTRGDYMRYADVSYEGERYRAVYFSQYRPRYTFEDFDAVNSYQSMNGYALDEIYWFRFEPIEWRLIDGDNFFVADIVLDAQPFNESIFNTSKSVTLNGCKYYAFSDAECTTPVNEWETSSIRKWLNGEFFGAAFSEDEKKMIQNSLIQNCGERFGYQDTTDKVFLLSADEVNSENYCFADSAASYISESTDYAKCQGVSSKLIDGIYTAPWLLRTSGRHSSDISYVKNIGYVNDDINAAATMVGIRPALRVAQPSQLVPQMLTAPGYVKAVSTGTKEITVRSAVCNGADGYRFYRYVDGSMEPEEVIETQGCTLRMSGLTPGVSYTFRVVAFRNENGQTQEKSSPMSEPVKCQTFLSAPLTLQAKASATGAVTLTYDRVSDAVGYRVYHYIDSVHMKLCGFFESESAVVTGLSEGSTYYFRVSAVSADGYESPVGKTIARCMCISIPPKPQGVSAEATGTGEITVSWDAVTGAGRYHVYQYITETELKCVGTTDGTSLAVSGLYTGSTYYFRVTSETADSSSASSYSEVVSALCRSVPEVPTDLQAESTAPNTIRLSWKASYGAARYHIYRYVSATETQRIATVTGTEYTDTGLYGGSAYVYRICAESADGKYTSAFTPVCRATAAKLLAPRNIAATATATGELTLNWQFSEYAGAYIVEQYVSKDTYRQIDKTANNFCRVDGLRVGTDYYFRVAAVTPDGSVMSAYSYVNGLCREVSGVVVTPNPTEIGTQPPTSAPTVPVYVGDTDMDGKVTILDATAIQRRLASLETLSYNELAADADEDGKVTVLDATSIQRYLASLPAPEHIGLPI